VSNINRAVTRTRRAVTTSRGTRIGALPWPGPAVYRNPGTAAQLPPFTVTRRAPKSGAPQGQPMSASRRTALYLAGGRSRPTPAQRRSLRKNANRQLKREAAA
jgi:hypothetical protein